MAISGVKSGIPTDLLQAIHQTIGITRNINVPRVPPIITARRFVFCVSAVDVSGEVTARVVDEIDKVEVLVKEDGSLINGAEDDVVEVILEDNVLEEDMLKDVLEEDVLEEVLEEEVLEDDVMEEEVLEEEVLEEDMLEEDGLEEDGLEEGVLEENVLVDGRGTGIPNATSWATVGSNDG